MQEKYVVFTGRPNAGKSSLINKIVGLKLATGKRPGTTRKISKYPLKGGLILVDLPGLGKMMRASKRCEEKVNQQIVEFLENNAQNIVLAVIVFDISTFFEVTWRLEKKGFKSVDVEMVRFLEKKLDEFPIVVANKSDKINKKEIKANYMEFLNRISDYSQTKVKENVFLVSVKSGRGLGELRATIHERLAGKGYRTPFKI